MQLTHLVALLIVSRSPTLTSRGWKQEFTHPIANSLLAVATLDCVLDDGIPRKVLRNPSQAIQRNADAEEVDDSVDEDAADRYQTQCVVQ